ncbi:MULTISPECIES: type IV toxin-antitoxin system AbiEi family antitoxin domain-containing protein [unclassified Actinomyces]|uniref:type IV toxin-antitoxin system AbiEi family antitoxin domain-containing protein n=1 Tax=unclassified Actinomyces TaxID=2609248 RepID=UPI000D59617B|nr:MULTISPECIES: type IV toxin-antitoxin system AbiEi family antitoxin domain-containing protein [unclassified Actinomyces]RAX20036.1 hypothetical protein DRB06_09990 [Actinomyces sp. Z5]RAX22505.1 hypothetical protein DRB07_08235 [Actinomyces sp. Z3]
MRTADALRTLSSAAGSQRGLITTAQAARVGIDRTSLTRLTTSEALTRVRHGVYALPGSDHDPHQDLRAAWLGTDPKRFADERAHDPDSPTVSHVSAAALHDIGEIIPARHTFTAPTRKQTRQPDIRYRQRPLDHNDVTVIDGIAVTTIPRTIADLAAEHTEMEHLSAVVRDAAGIPQADLGDIAAALNPHASAYGHATGADLVQALLEIAGPPAAALQTAQFALSTLLSQLEINKRTIQQAQAAMAPIITAANAGIKDSMQHTKPILTTANAAIQEALKNSQYPGLVAAIRQIADITALLDRSRSAAAGSTHDNDRTGEEGLSD